MTTATKPKARDNGRLSLVDAAFRALSEVGTPLSMADLLAAIGSKQLWTPPRGGRTPDCSLRSAIYVDLRRGDKSRFIRHPDHTYSARQTGTEQVA